MRFRVPQFIDIEDEIFGPLSLQQFLYLAGAVGASIAIYIFLPLPVAIVLILAILGFAAALAFFEVNNRPFIYTVESFLKYIIQPRLYVWKRERKKREKSAKDVNVDKARKQLGLEDTTPRVSGSSLENMAGALETQDNLTSDDEESNQAQNVAEINTLSSNQQSKEAREEAATEEERFEQQTGAAQKKQEAAETKQKGEGDDVADTNSLNLQV